MGTLIEDLLHSKGVRYFHGHHRDEFFFLVDLRHGRLHVHLDAGPDGAVTIGITPDRYYPTHLRGRLAELAARSPAALGEVSVHDSCDPALVGVATRREVRPAGPADLGPDLEAAVAAAIEFFTGIGGLAAGAPPLRDAG